MISLGDLVWAIPRAWSAETRGKQSFSGKHPAAGQCTVSSLLIQRHHGGSIIRCIVGPSHHYFNNLDGVWLDITRAQFGKRPWPYRSIELEPRLKDFVFPDTWGRVDLLEERVVNELTWR